MEGSERLQSLIFIDFENFGGVGSIIHEIAHRWVNYLDPFDRTFHWEYSIVVSTIPLGLECVEDFDRVSMLISSTRDIPSVIATATGHRASLEPRLDHFLPTPTVVEVSDSRVPGGVELMQNAPNPFNGATSIRFTLPRSEHVELSIFNTAGQSVPFPILGRTAAGVHQVQWDGRDSAVDCYRLTAGEGAQVRKLLLLP